MNSTKPILEINNLKKVYRMGVINSSTLMADWQAFWARRRGEEDPRFKVHKNRLVGQSFMALNGIDLKVYPGEAVGVIGVNGAGKSTMLKIISRITAPTTGEIIIRGKIASMLEVGTGFDKELTGLENIYMNGTILGMKKNEIDAKLEDIINFSECRDFINTPVKRYSSGMYVKLAFAVAAHLDSDIMIMDEVLAVGDTNFQKKSLEKMSEAAASGKTVLYVSHNMSTIRQLCTRVIVLKEGQIIFDGDVEEGISVYSNESFNFSLRQEFNKNGNFSSAQAAAVTAIEIADRNDMVFAANEKMHLNIEMKLLKKADDVAMIITPKYAGANIVGSFVTQPFNAEPCDKFTYRTELDLSNITPGKYFCDVQLCKISAGKIIRYDEISNAFGFEISSNAAMQSLNWRSDKWGYSVFHSTLIDTERETAE